MALFLARLFLALGHVLGFVHADTLRPCSDGSVCRNGGQCFLTAAFTQAAKCPSGVLSDTDNQCLYPVAIRMSYEDACSYCSSKYDGRLVDLNNEQKKTLLAKTLEKPVWIGLQRNGGRLTRHPSGDEVQVDGLEGDAGNGTRCAVFHPSNARTVLKSCVADQEFVCESKAPKFNHSMDYIVQCSCPPGYSGVYCEVESTEPDDEDKELCRGEFFEKKCGRGQKVVIDFAMYGTSQNVSLRKSCGSSPKSKFECVDQSALTKLSQRCHGLQSCHITDYQAIFENKVCSQESKLRYRATCKKQMAQTCKYGALVKDRCIEFSNPKGKRSYDEARADCSQKGGDLAFLRPDYDYRLLINQMRPQPSHEFWVHNSSEHIVVLGPRKSECLSVSWWTTFAGQVPCFAQLGYICEFLPLGSGVTRLIDSARLVLFLPELEDLGWEVPQNLVIKNVMPTSKPALSGRCLLRPRQTFAN